MARLEYQAECVCGGKILAVFKKPTQMQPTLRKASCRECKSVFMFTCFKGQNEKGPYYYTKHEVTDMTRQLKDKLKEKYGRPKREAGA